MAIEVPCRCGTELRIESGRSIVCPTCGREHIVHREHRGLLVAMAVAAAFAILSVGLLGALIGISRTASAPQVVMVEPEPQPEPKAEPPAPVFVDPIPELPAPPPAPIEQPPPAQPMPQPVAPPPPPPMPRVPRGGQLEAKIEPAGRYRVGETIRQEVRIVRKSKYEIASLPYEQSADYRLISQLLITAIRDDGSMVVTQTIESGKLESVDAQTRGSLSDALAKAKGKQFELIVEANGAIRSVSGIDQQFQLEERANADQTKTLRVWSLLDRDAWRELAALTFFQPTEPLKLKATWRRPFEHDWGSLGRWTGQTTYQAVGKQAGRAGQEKIAFQHSLTYQRAKEAEASLPFRVAQIDFRPGNAGGAILYDPLTQRSTMADEWFQVRGSLLVNLEGITATIAMEEQQVFRLVIGQPLQQELTGQPPAIPKGK